MITLRALPVAFRALFSSFLILIGIGYLTALSLLFLTTIQPYLGIGQSIVEDISEKYHGLPSDTRLEAALKGPMAMMASDRDKDAILRWIHHGATEEGYATVAAIFQNNCVSCHNPRNNNAIPALTSYDEIKKLVTTNAGETIVQLARVSHIHLFGISIIFMLTGMIFALSETPAWFRVTLVVVPYVAIIMDIGSWWLTKYYDPTFAYIVLIGGAGMGLALAAQILISLWEMWTDFWKTAMTGLFAALHHEIASFGH